MQTFLPHPDFRESLAALDYRRLGKQRVEAMQLIRALTGVSAGWRNHPAAVMWEGHLDALKLYHDLSIDEWVRRGYRNTMVKYNVEGEPSMPPWVGDADFHASHRSNLLRKDPAHYGQFGWAEPDNLPYIWPGSPVTA